MFLVHLHSFFGWLLLLVLIAAIAMAFIKKNGNRSFAKSDKSLFLVALILTHLQLVIGIVQYFLSQKVLFSGETMSNAALRFFTVEHPFTMILAIVAITLGYSRSKRAADDGTKFKYIYVWYGIGLLLILLRFPWQYLSAIGRGWFV